MFYIINSINIIFKVKFKIKDTVGNRTGESFIRNHTVFNSVYCNNLPHIIHIC